MKKTKFLSLVCLILVSVFTFTACTNTAQTPETKNENDLSFFSTVTISQLNGDVSYTPTINASPTDKIEIPLLTGDIYEVCKNYEVAITDNYNKNKEDCFAPTPLTISWESVETPLYYILDLSTNADMSNAESYVTFDNSVTFEYLFMGYNYYYQIQAKFEDKIVKSRIFEFKTAYLPRTIYVDDNVSNTRDWGGYLCEDGIHRVKQGIVYRGGKLEAITEQGKQRMLVDLGIVTDLDVRGDGEATSNISPLGEEVQYIETKGPYYLGNDGIDFGGTLSSTRQAYKEALITEIKAFANPSNFPIYVHCSLGRDRTGTLCFLISALLGVDKMDIYRDYEISMMSITGKADNQTAKYMVKGTFTSLYNYISRYRNSKSASEGARKYMLDLGITEEEIEAIKANMLEEIK